MLRCLVRTLLISAALLRQGSANQDPQEEAARLISEAEELESQARFGEAEQRLLAAAKKAQAWGLAPTWAAALNNLGSLYQDQGRLLEARRCYEQAIRLWERAGVSDSLGLSRPLNNLAALLRQMGQLSQAEKLYQQSLTIRERARAGRHPDLARTWLNLATLYISQRRLREAELAARRALEIFSEALGPDSVEVANARTNLAAALWHQRRAAEAEHNARLALEIWEHAGAPDYGEKAQALKLLAVCYAGRGLIEEAETLFLRAITGIERAFGANHMDLPDLWLQYARLLKAARRKGDAEEAEKRAKVIMSLNAERNLTHHTVDVGQLRKRDR